CARSSGSFPGRGQDKCRHRAADRLLLQRLPKPLDRKRAPDSLNRSVRSEQMPYPSPECSECSECSVSHAPGGRAEKSAAESDVPVACHQFPVTYKPMRIVISALTLLLLPPFSTAQQKHAIPPIVITHVTVINPGTSSVQANRTVVIRLNRITEVVDAKKFHVPKNAWKVDGRGQYLIPALWAMPVPSAFGDWFPGGRDIILPLFIANGVTGVRDMGGDIPVLMGWRKEITHRNIIGPRMVISGPMLDAYLPNGKLRFPSSIAVSTPASAVAAVDQLKSQGVDFIKVQSVISHDAYLAAAAEAHKQGLPIVGHVPDKVRLQEVVEAGQKSIEHLMGIFEGCSTEEDKFIKGEGNLKLLLTTQDQQRCDSLIKLLAKNQTWQVPTLAWQRGGTFLDQRDLKHQPLDKYVPAYWRDVTWRRFTEEMMPDLQRDPLALRQEY